MNLDGEHTGADHILIRQTDILISLLARSVIGIDFIREVVTRGKKDAAAYVKAHNALDGTIGVSEAAKVAGVSQGTMSVVLKGWEEQGIICNVGEPGRPLYKRLVVLGAPPKQREHRRRRGSQ